MQRTGCESVSVKYLTTKKLSGGTRKEYKSTVTKWTAWGTGVDLDKVARSHREFLDWVHEKAEQQTEELDHEYNPLRITHAGIVVTHVVQQANNHRTRPPAGDLGKRPAWNPCPQVTLRCRWRHYDLHLVF